MRKLITLTAIILYCMSGIPTATRLPENIKKVIALCVFLLLSCVGFSQNTGEVRLRQLERSATPWKVMVAKDSLADITRPYFAAYMDPVALLDSAGYAPVELDSVKLADNDGWPAWTYYTSAGDTLRANLPFNRFCDSLDVQTLIVGVYCYEWDGSSFVLDYQGWTQNNLYMYTAIGSQEDFNLQIDQLANPSEPLIFRSPDSTIYTKWYPDLGSNTAEFYINPDKVVLVDSVPNYFTTDSIYKSGGLILLRDGTGSALLLDDDPTNEIQDLTGIRDTLDVLDTRLSIWGYRSDGHAIFTKDSLDVKIVVGDSIPIGDAFLSVWGSATITDGLQVTNSINLIGEQKLGINGDFGDTGQVITPIGGDSVAWRDIETIVPADYDSSYLTGNILYNQDAIGVDLSQFLDNTNYWTLNGSDIYRNSNVGIGTTSPSYKLDVKGSQRIWDNTNTDFILRNPGGTGNSLIFWEQADGTEDFYFGQTSEGGSLYLYNYTSGVFGMTFNTSGNMGIGTISPSAKLDVVGDAEISTSLDVGTTLDVGGEATIDDGVHVNDTRSDGDVSPSAWAEKNYEFWFTDDITASPNAWDAGFTVKGWSSPYASWQLFSNANTNNNEQLMFRAGNATWGSIHTLIHTGNLGDGLSWDGNELNGVSLLWQDNGTYISPVSGASFNIEDGGNVGIGTTSPSEALDVVGGIEVSDITGTPTNLLATSASGKIVDSGISFDDVASVQDTSHFTLETDTITNKPSGERLRLTEYGKGSFSLDSTTYLAGYSSDGTYTEVDTANWDLSNTNEISHPDNMIINGYNDQIGNVNFSKFIDRSSYFEAIPSKQLGLRYNKINFDNFDFAATPIDLHIMDNRIYVVSNSDDSLNVYTYTDFSDITFEESIYLGTQDISPYFFKISNGGRWAAMGGIGSDQLSTGHMSTPYDLSTLEWTKTSGFLQTNPYGWYIADDWRYLYIIDNTDILYQYEFATAYDASTLTLIDQVNLSSIIATGRDLHFEDGILNILGSGDDNIHTFLMNENDLSDYTYLGFVNVSGGDTNPLGLDYKDDKFYITGSSFIRLTEMDVIPTLDTFYLDNNIPIDTATSYIFSGEFSGDGVNSMACALECFDDDDTSLSVEYLFDEVLSTTWTRYDSVMSFPVGTEYVKVRFEMYDTTKVKDLRLFPIFDSSTIDSTLIAYGDSIEVNRTDIDNLANIWERTGTDVHLKNSGDNVGIGTSSPSEKLDVVGDAEINGKIKYTDQGGTSVSVVGQDASGYLTTTSVNVDDADADPNNEIQTINKVAQTVTLSDGGGSFTDDVDDADASTTNEGLMSLTTFVSNAAYTYNSNTSGSTPLGVSEDITESENNRPVQLILNGTSVTFDLPIMNLESFTPSSSDYILVADDDDGDDVKRALISSLPGDGNTNLANNTLTFNTTYTHDLNNSIQFDTDAAAHTLIGFGGDIQAGRDVFAIRDSYVGGKIFLNSSDEGTSGEFLRSGGSGSDAYWSTVNFMDNWNLQANGGASTSIEDNETVNFTSTGLASVSRSGNTIVVSASGDGVNDADASPTNELQDLSVSDPGGGNAKIDLSVGDDVTLVAGELIALDPDGITDEIEISVNNHFAQMYISAYSITGTGIVNNLLSEFDVGDFTNSTANDRITWTGADGYCRAVLSSVVVAQSDNNGQIHIEIRRNGVSDVTHSHNVENELGTTWTDVNINQIFTCNENDYFDIYVQDFTSGTDSAIDNIIFNLQRL